MQPHILHLASRFYCRCKYHDNPLIQTIGNYTHSSLKLMYKKYKHKRPGIDCFNGPRRWWCFLWCGNFHYRYEADCVKYWTRIKPELKVAGSWCWERLLYNVYMELSWSVYLIC
jgi:hypothetical protein